MAKYDVENLLADIKTILVNNLNTKLAAIDSEKNDGITLKTVAEDAYILQSMDAKSANYNPYILYGVVDIEGEGFGPMTQQILQIQVALVLADFGEQEMGKVMLRYLRALQEVIEDNWTENNNGVKLSISSLVPIDLQNINTSNRYKAVGLDIRAALG